MLIADTVMMMSSYSDAVVIRHPQPGAVTVCVLVRNNSLSIAHLLGVLLLCCRLASSIVCYRVCCFSYHDL